MGQALYRSHRPKSLNEVVGQEHITKTLDQALKQGRISHAYLLTGPRGVGKTSIARILAHEINNLPYKDDSAHIDIIEIDAASNRRIDEIRELREKVYTAPAQAKYKVYIIDEVHMLTREAFNALLKTLEEPPEHAVFILATTDAHKLPETIISRTQRFSFRPVEKTKVIEHLKAIAKEEGIKVSNEALALLAEHGEGSFRDSISLLDQASSHGQALGVEDVQLLLGIPSTLSIEKLINILTCQGTSAELISELDALYGQGFQPAAIAKQLGQSLRHHMVAGELAMDREKALQLLADLIGVPVAHDPARYLEVCLLKVTPSNAVTPTPAERVSDLPEDVVEEIQDVVEDVPETTQAKKTAKSALATEADAAIWPEALGLLKQRHNTLYGVVRMAQPDFSEPGHLRLLFGFAFHQKRGNETANKDKLAKIIEELTGKAVVIECLLDKDAKPPKTAPIKVKKNSSADLSTISNIFGSAELLES